MSTAHLNRLRAILEKKISRSFSEFANPEKTY
jgi:hypothetical protein